MLHLPSVLLLLDFTKTGSRTRDGDEQQHHPQRTETPSAPRGVTSSSAASPSSIEPQVLTIFTSAFEMLLSNWIVEFHFVTSIAQIHKY